MAENMAEKATAAFILSLIGGIIILVTGIAIAAVGAVLGGLIAGLGAVAGQAEAGAALGAAFALPFVMGLVCGIMIIVGSVLQYSVKRSRVRIGSILVLIFAVISLPFTFGGFIIGFILCLIGAILGLVWKPSVPTPPPSPPPV